MENNLLIIGILIFIFLGTGCEKKEVTFGDRADFFGNWAVDWSVVSTREDGVVVWDYEEIQNRVLFREDGIMIEDRGFQKDTSTWFYAADPPTLIFGNYAGSFIYGPAGLFAKTFDVVEKSEGYYLLGSEAYIQDSMGREIHVVERWEMVD